MLCRLREAGQLSQSDKQGNRGRAVKRPAKLGRQRGVSLREHPTPWAGWCTWVRVASALCCWFHASGWTPHPCPPQQWRVHLGQSRGWRLSKHPGTPPVLRRRPWTARMPHLCPLLLHGGAGVSLTPQFSRILSEQDSLALLTEDPKEFWFTLLETKTGKK